MIQHEPPRHRYQGIFISLVSLLVSAALCEVVLRLFDIPSQPFLEEVQFGWPDPQTVRDRYTRDRELFWIPKHYATTIAAAQHNRPHIVFLGDSCTEFSSYPAKVVEGIRRRTEDKNVRGLSVGVGGWSSAQGLRQLERDIIPLSPKIVTVFFGWNDHWKHFGASDLDVAWVGAPVFFAPLRLSTVELVKRAYVTHYSDPHGVRVPLPDFTRILQRMVATSRRNGIKTLLVTAPTSHVPGKEPAYLAKRWVYDLRDLVPTHKLYVNAIREVAASTGAHLCDVADYFEKLPAHQREKDYMSNDGIHLTPTGNNLLADLLTDCFIRERLTKLLTD